ncbi:hypothetical protein OROGR_003000 [Orobanche gracilis]
MRILVGRLIGRAFLSNSLSPAKSRNRYVFPSLIFFRSLKVAQFEEYPKSKYYEMGGEVKGGSVSNPGILTTEEVQPRSKYYEMGGEAKGGYVSNPGILTTEEVQKQRIDKGDIVNMHDLLFTSNRDYLVKYNNQQVIAKQLEGKVIALLFIPLCLDHHFARWTTMLLTEVYNNLPSNSGFEVVFVAINDLDYGDPLPKDPHKHFLDMFSLMPWTAIPFSDIPTEEYLHRRFGFHFSIGSECSIVIVDPMSVVLQYRDSVKIIELYGALGYPFSDERIEYLESEFNAAAAQPSLKTIMASPQRDYVISNTGEKVPIHTLEDKVVAIIFYEETNTNDSAIECLKIAYRELAKNKEKFEVVLVYLTDTVSTFECTDEKSFWKKFKTMPWLAVPFKDPIHKKLKRIFEYLPHEDISPYYPPRIVIFGPHGEFVEPLGDIILHFYGTPAYPFTRAKIAKLDTEKVKDLKLELLWDPNTMFSRKDGSQVPFSQLLGMKVIIFFERNLIPSRSLQIKFLKMLKRMYLQTKSTYDEFEVIYICESKVEDASINDAVGDLPWLVSSASELLSDDYGFYSMYGVMSMSLTLAFDRDGRLVRKTIYPLFDTMEFPFCTGNLEEEALAQLNTWFMWNYWDYYRYGGQIYSARDKKLHIELP